jgi:putative tricarboxylic transport membrane protein
MRRDAVLGSATLALGALYYWLADSVIVSQLADAIGPQGLPKIYAVGLIALSLVLIGSSARASPESRVPLPGSDLAPPDSRAAFYRAAGMLAIGIVYVLAVPYLGYMLAIAAVIATTIYYQGGELSRRTLVIALAGGVFFWVLFVVLMGISQPPGFFPPRI